MEDGVSGVRLPRAVTPVAVDSVFASGTVTTPLHQAEARSVQEKILRLKTAKQILVSHTNHWYKSL